MSDKNVFQLSPTPKKATFSFRNLGALTYCFMVLTILIGFFLISIGIDIKNDDNDWLLATMITFIPGILLILSSLLYTRYASHSSVLGFIFMNAALVFLIGFLLECFYFQFIYFGFRQPQYKMTIPAAIISAATAVFDAILFTLYSCFRKLKK